MTQRYTGTTTKSKRVPSLSFVWNRPLRGVDVGQYMKLTVRHYLGYWSGIIFYDQPKQAIGYMCNDDAVQEVRYEAMPYKDIVAAMQEYIENFVIETEAQRDIKAWREGSNE